jgi:hypothetical protein
MTGEKTMHTDEEILRAAERAETLDPSGVPMDDTADLRAITEAADGVRAGQARVRERFSDKVPA